MPLMITLDGEWGLAMRINDTPQFPNNMALGDGNDLNGIYEYGREVARQCREMGIHVNFAPVADDNINPDNPEHYTLDVRDDSLIIARRPEFRRPARRDLEALPLLEVDGQEGGGVLRS